MGYNGSRQKALLGRNEEPDMDKLSIVRFIFLFTAALTLSSCIVEEGGRRHEEQGYSDEHHDEHHEHHEDHGDYGGYH